MDKLALQAPFIQPVQHGSFHQKKVFLHVLRLDVLHPVISGNKWFKLKEYFQDAKGKDCKEIVTFGGAFSNHIVAASAAAHYYGLESSGIIRGEEGNPLSPTLRQAKAWGMKLFFITREDYKKKSLPKGLSVYPNGAVYLINEGGYGEKGATGAATILDFCAREQYTHICAAVGTGTTLAGLVNASSPGQQVIGVTALKNNYSIEEEVTRLVTNGQTNFRILYGYHFGGYAKYTTALIRFMNDWYRQTGIPSDFVYTGKLFFAVTQLVEGDYFMPGSNILVIHSGGLQGNASMPPETLIF